MDTLLETTHLFGDFLAVLVSWPIQIVYAWYKGLTFTFPWGSSTTDEDLQSVSSDESRPQSRVKQRPQAHTRQRSNNSTGSVQDPTDGFAAHQIWYPPPPAYEEEDHSQVRPPPLPVPSLYSNTRSPDEWRKYPDFPSAYPLSPVQGPIPPPGFQIVAPVPKRPSDVIDIDNMSNSGQSDGSEVNDDETRPGFHRSLLSSREFRNPNSVVRSSDEYPTHGVQLEEKSKTSKRKRKRMALEGGEVEGGDGEEDGMDVDEQLESTADTDEEMDDDGSEDDGHAGDTTFTTPRIRLTGMTMDSDAEMGDASGSERENSFSLQTPLPTWRGLPRGRRTMSSVTLKGTTLDPRKNARDARLKIDTTSPPRPLPPHLAPQLSATPSGSSLRSASTTLSTLGGGDSLMTGGGSDREEIETPLSPEFPSPITYTVDPPSAVSPPFPVPDVDPAFMIPGNVRGTRLFPRTNSTSTRSRPPIQTIAITSSSSGGASSRASSRTRATKRAQGLQPTARKKNVGVSGPTRMGARPVAKGTENVPISMPISILVSDSEDARRSEEMEGGTGADAETDTHSDAPSLNKKQKISSASLRKTLSSQSRTMPPPPKKRLVAPQKPVQIAKSTSFNTSSSSANVGARKKVGPLKSDKSAVRTTRVRNGGAESTSESGGLWYSN